MSPNYPNSYPNNAEETWLISAPTGSIINLQFHSFHVRHIIQFGKKMKNQISPFHRLNIYFIFPFSKIQQPSWVDTDFLIIYDGPNDQLTQIAKLSGNLGSFRISSTGNSLFVIFESSYSLKLDNGGFLATIHYGIQ